jgi:hypothetical protein
MDRARRFRRHLTGRRNGLEPGRYRLFQKLPRPEAAARFFASRRRAGSTPDMLAPHAGILLMSYSRMIQTRPMSPSSTR